MLDRAARSPGNDERWPRPTLSIAIASAALFVSLGGSAVAQKLIDGANIAKATVTSKTIKNGTVNPKDLSAKTLAVLRGGTGLTGSKGEIGPTGITGAAGAVGASGINGTNGTHGTHGTDGTDGANGTAGLEGTDGTNGTNGTDGIIAPLSTTAGTVTLPGPAGTPPTEVVSLTVPAGPNYVVLAKTQLTHSGAGDRVDCVLFSGSDEIDRVAIAPGPALTEAPVSMQAVTTTPTTELSVECNVLTADGTASSTSLIAIPIG